MRPVPEDGAAMWQLAKSTSLDMNSPYKYLMMGKFFSETCVVAKEKEAVVGFATAFLQPERPDVLFIWQIGVDASKRGHGIASRMLEELLLREACKHVNYVEATVTPANKASQSLFRRLARDRMSACEVSECFSAEAFPAPGHEAEFLYRVGPLSD
nr:diaminobutyrate acetyltransferase [Evansella caseinilytica]